MSAVAILMKEQGWKVSGSDDNFYPPISTVIESSGIKFFKGYSKGNLSNKIDIIVIGKHAGLTPENNEEVAAAFQNKAKVISFPELLGEITKHRTNIVVAGSYGKSTCSALLAWCLIQSGKDPGYFIGAASVTPKKGSNLGTGKEFILEGDEYPAANWDDNSKFLYYHPSYVLLTSLAHDHLNVYPTAESYRKSFEELLRSVPSQGKIFACLNGEAVVQTLAKLKINATTYGSKNSGAQWYYDNLELGDISTFNIYKSGIKIVTISTNLLGKHNMENIVGVAAVLLSLNLITPEKFAEAVKNFKPLERRLDKKSDKTFIPIYEGFGSSVDKAKAAIQTMRLYYPGKKIIVLFEPHALSWLIPTARHWYSNVFKEADEAIIYYPKKLDGPNKLTCLELLSEIKIIAYCLQTTEQIINQLKKDLDKNSLVLILTSGSFDGAIPLVIDFAKTNFPKS